MLHDNIYIIILARSENFHTSRVHVKLKFRKTVNAKHKFCSLRTNQDGKRERTVNAEGNVLSGTSIFRPLEIYFAVSCPIILAVDARRVKRDSALDVRHCGNERNSKDGAPLRCKPAAVSEDGRTMGAG